MTAVARQFEHERPARLPDGRLRSDLCNALVRLYRERCGLGPTSARAFLADQFIFVVLADWITTAELTLISHGEHDLVRSFRLQLHEALAPAIRAAVEDIVDRTVIGHHIQIGFDPHRIFERFELRPDYATASWAAGCRLVRTS